MSGAARYRAPVRERGRFGSDATLILGAKCCLFGNPVDVRGCRCGAWSCCIRRRLLSRLNQRSFLDFRCRPLRKLRSGPAGVGLNAFRVPDTRAIPCRITMAGDSQREQWAFVRPPVIRSLWSWRRRAIGPTRTRRAGRKTLSAVLNGGRSPYSREACRNARRQGKGYP